MVANFTFIYIIQNAEKSHTNTINIALVSILFYHFLSNYLDQIITLKKDPENEIKRHNDSATLESREG